MNVWEFMSDSPILTFFILWLIAEFICKIIQLFINASVKKSKYKAGIKDEKTEN